MTVTFSDDILQTTHMTANELAVEIALMLFQKEKLTFWQAARMARLNHFEFQKLLGSRQISLHYGIAEFQQDVKTLEEAGRL